MNSSRRKFIQSSALTLAGAALFSNKLFAEKPHKEILGIQLYSVRDDMKTDPAGTLKQLAAMGYQYVEHANYVDRKFYGYSPADFKKLLGDVGLKMHSGHTVMNEQHWDDSKKEFTDLWKHTIEDAATVGEHYVISPWLDKSWYSSYDVLQHYMEVFNKSGELCKASGLTFGYHNHNFEFNTQLNNTRLYDLILKLTDPALVAQQLDMGNMYGAGGRAMDILKQYPGRFALLHVKDEIKSTSGDGMDGYESTILGKGVIHTRDIIDLAKKSGGTTYYIIEQESYQGLTSLDCARQDYSIMKQWGY